jgi:RNA polymerase sigma-70 factor (ECF subfamily)
MAQPRKPTSKTSDDAQFERTLAAARAGDAEALGTLLEGCRRYLLFTASRALESTLRPKEGASDLVQRTFLVAHEDFQSFRGTTLGELLAWLHRILERQLAGQVRRYKQTAKRDLHREVPLDSVERADMLGLRDGRPAPLDNAVVADEQRRVTLALERMSHANQQVLRLRTWEGLPFAEIGRQLDISAGAAEMLWSRAVERLHALLNTVS